MSPIAAPLLSLVLSAEPPADPTPATAGGTTGIDPVALGVAVATCLLFAGLGLRHARRARSASLDEYLTARNSMGAGLGTATLVATLAGTWILSSPGLVSCYYGVAALLGYAVGQAMPMLLFPLAGNRVRALAPDAESLSDLVGRRYGPLMRAFVSLIAVFYMGVYLAAELTAIAFAGRSLVGLELWIGGALVAAATVAYAATGGIRTAIAVDRIQVWLIVLLLALVAAVVFTALPGPALGPVGEQSPELLRFTAVGWENAAVLVLGITASNLYDNSFWARVFACRDERTVRRSFTWAGLAIAPIIALAGLIGLWAVGRVPDAYASSATFDLVHAVAPRWAALAVLVLALLLAMSTLSALFNAIAGVLATDARALGAAEGTVLRWAKVATVALAVPGVWVAAQGYDPTYLFFIANLVCAGALVPTFAGLWNRRLGGGSALVASLLGIVVGLLWFPKNLAGDAWLTDIPFGQRFITAYVLALVVSGVSAVVLAWVVPRRDEALIEAAVPA